MARTFDGTSQVLTNDAAVESYFAQTSPLSISFWFKGSSTSGDDYVIAGGNSGTNNMLFAITRETNGRPRIIIRNHGNSVRINWTTTFAGMDDNFWKHYCCALDGAGNVKFFEDGVKQTNSYTPDGVTTANRFTLMGLRRVSTPSNFCGGHLADVAIFDYELPDHVCVALGTGVRPTVFRPVRYWPLWGVDSPEPDLGSASPHAAVALTASPGAYYGPKGSPDYLDF